MENGEYVAIASSVLDDGTLSLHSQVLGLDLHLYPSLGFRFFDPISHEILRSHAEAEFERVYEQRARFQAELERSFEHQARIEAEQRAESLAERLRMLGIDPEI